MEAQTAKTKDQKPMIKMVTPVDQATEMAMAELKRERDALQRKTLNRITDQSEARKVLLKITDQSEETLP